MTATTSLIDRILEKTNGGADIIISYYPEAAKCFGTNKKFSIRNESDPSASWYQFRDTKKWAITDWGVSNKPKDAIQIAMEIENLDQHSAVQMLCNRYGITTGKGKEQQHIRKEPLTEHDSPDAFSFTEAVMTPEDVRYWGKYVKASDLTAFGWITIASTRKVYDNYALVKESSQDYPIFIRKCFYEDENGNEAYFYKIYEPMNLDKGFRFRYEGKKPAGYVNGLHEATLAHKQEADQQVDIKKQKPVVICCGERDAMAAYAFGCKPIWYNSESAFPTKQEEIDKLKELGPGLYFVPDIDNTGIRKGKELALRFPELKTVWLPFSLKEQKDWRGNPKKDLCDWASIPGNDFKAFHGLLHASLTAEYFAHTDKGAEYINDSAMQYFLWLHGFGSFEFKEGNETRLRYARRKGCSLIEIKQPSVVLKFLKDHIAYDGSRSYRCNLLDRNRSLKLSLDGLASSSMIPYSLTQSTKGIEYVFFENTVVTVTAGNIVCAPADSFDGMTMECNVIRHTFKMPQQMPITFHTEDPDALAITIHYTDSHFLQMAINMSRIYWHEEFVNSGLSEADFYKECYTQIVAPNLDDRQNSLQLRCFLNLCYNIGFLMATYKRSNEKFAPYFVDYMSDNETSNGRTGKGTLFEIFDKIFPTLFFNGRDKQLTDYGHAFDRVTPETKRVRIDDYNPSTNSFGALYNTISDVMVINPKGKKQFSLPYDQSPKVFFTSNFFLKDDDASTRGRINYSVISDWYHKATPANGHSSDHEPTNDFHMVLGQDYSEQNWNDDEAFLLCCLQFYMKMSVQNRRVEVPEEILDHKRAVAVYSAEFDEWLSNYIYNKIGVDLVRSVMMSDYKYSTRTDIKSRTFGQWVKAWASANGYDINKGKSLDSNGRYMKYNQGYANSVEHYCFTSKE